MMMIRLRTSFIPRPLKAMVFLLAMMLIAGCQPDNSLTTTNALEPNSAEGVAIAITLDADKAVNHSDMAAFLSAYYALNQENAAIAAEEFSHALSLKPNDIDLMKMTFTALYYNGDIDQAAEVASKLEKQGEEVGFGSEPALILAAEERDWIGMNVLAGHLMADTASRPLGIMMMAWGLAIQDQGDAGLTLLLELHDNDQTDPPYALFTQSALISEYLNRPNDALASAKMALGHDTINIGAVINMAGILARQGEVDNAIAILDERLGQLFDRKMILDGLRNGSSPLLNKPSLSSLLSEAIVEASSIPLSVKVSLLPRLHMARRIEPSNQRITYLLGLSYRDLDDDKRTDAYHQLIKESSYWHAPALFLRARRLSFDEATYDDAKTLFENLSQSITTSSLIWRQAGDAARRRDDNNYAIKAYDMALAIEPENARLHYHRAITMDVLDRNEDAEAGLRKSIELDPQNAYALNYLGYWLLEEGGNPNEALGFIRTAIEKQPQNGFFMDSLGWGYFKLEQFEQAALYLERAITLEPLDPIITDHLGDAYFELGRTREAVFQWQRALVLNPEDDLIKAINDKINSTPLY